MKNIKYVLLAAILIGITACNDEEDFVDSPEQIVYPALTSGSADFSNYVSIGNSLTSGYTDNALFIAAQENSFPNTLAQKFALLGGGDFTQPLMNDNVGGLLFGGLQDPSGRFGPRLYFDGEGPAQLPGMPTTEVFGPTTGSKNNMGVPGAASFHLLFDGYGNPANLLTGLANPYYVRMASAPNATILGDALAQAPTFVSLWIGANDVLGYATSGGDQTLGAITPMDGPPGVGFNESISFIVSALQGANVQGVMANIPNISDLPYFTTVTHNIIPLDAATAATLNGAYGVYNATVQALVGVPPVMMTQEEADSRMINWEAISENAVVIMDESLSDLTIYDAALLSMRQATEDDLLVLPGKNFIGTEAVPGNPLTVNGVAIPLADNWVLVPSEQDEIGTAIDGYNATIQANASAAGFAFVDANAIFQQMANGGYADGDFILTADLVLGGAVSLDGVHPTSRGYALVANEFMKAIDATYDSNFEASGNLVDIGSYPTNYHPTLQ